MSQYTNVEQIEARCDAENERRGDDYWDVDGTVEDEERFDEACGAWH